MKNSIFTLVFFLLSISNNINSQWIQVANGMGTNVTVEDLTCNGNYLYAGTYGQGVFYSTNNGSNWVHTSIYPQYIYSLAAADNNIYAGAFIEGVYRSKDYGINWSLTPLVGRTVWSLAINGNKIFAGTYQYGVYISSDLGNNWLATGLYNQTNVYGLLAYGNTVLAGADGVYRSTDNGYSWNQTSLVERTVGSFTKNGNTVFAGAGFSYGVYKSTNDGLNWTQTTLNNRSIYALASFGNNIFASADFYGIYVSIDNGENWIEKNEGLGSSVFANSFCIFNGYIFAGLSNRSVYRRPLSELVNIEPISTEIPLKVSLYQNYPNPFNPNTKIKFQIHKSGFVNLEIYDALGRNIAALVNENLNAGVYEIQWNAVNQPSGIYFYRITTPDLDEVKKMVLIK